MQIGSSPRMRGKPGHFHGVQRVVRIIPAHAGQTSRRRRVPVTNSDHPRACGANVTLDGLIIVPGGSSPRMRGKRCDPSPRRRPRRIIPAHAGQTSQLEHSVYSPADHPRACGANVSSDGMLSRCTGSSPRMRGKPALHSRAGVGHRIIPAHAGQTRSLPLMLWSCPDHPRACGANSMRRRCCCRNVGSSPRMRGKRGGRRDIIGVLRIIPAHAGQTAFRAAKRFYRPDHPRACGANNSVAVTLDEPAGSSPRMRGKLGGWKFRKSHGRIIPAHAGQTSRAVTG